VGTDHQKGRGLRGLIALTQSRSRFRLRLSLTLALGLPNLPKYASPQPVCPEPLRLRWINSAEGSIFARLALEIFFEQPVKSVF
jgi:hypothetical protein